jgi:uncharacterized protein with HEPN domain
MRRLPCERLAVSEASRLFPGRGRFKRYADRLKALHPEVDWRAIAGFRNVLVHDYLGINLARIWEIVSVHLPVLRSQMEAIRRVADSPE